MDDPTRDVEVIRIGRDVQALSRDVVAREEPLEVRLGGSPFVVIMRTPGADRELVAGFLLAERVIQGAADIALIRHCADVDAEGSANVITVWLNGRAAERASDTALQTRPVAMNSACGVCGRRSVADLLHAVPPVGGGWTVPAGVLSQLPVRLRSTQAVFAATGGLHAAGLFGQDGRLVASAEDVGRHNAVDKVIGGQLLAGARTLGTRILMVSGRTSFEIVQKAAVAGIPVVASVSAPSSLAVELARDAGMTLVGFVRGDTFNVYSHRERVCA